jgi:TRIAP1/MDM35 family protein
MAHSLSPECTPLKHEYDACFNTWFDGYLEPAIANANTKKSPQAHRIEYSKQKKEEYDRKCGNIWAQYKDCVQVSLMHYGGRFSGQPLLDCLNSMFYGYHCRLECDADIYFLAIQKAVTEKGLGELLGQARQENPLCEPPPSDASAPS